MKPQGTFLSQPPGKLDRITSLDRDPIPHALVQALKKMGHDPAKEFNDRLIASMQAQGEAKTVTHKLTVTKAPFQLPPEDGTDTFANPS